MLRVDLESREVSGSVRGLIEVERDTIRMPGPVTLARAELGQKVHEQLRVRREAEVPGYRAEVAVQLVEVVDSFAVTLGGRADGVVQTDDVVLVEEVKSVALAATRLDELPVREQAEYALQVRLYALAISRRERLPVRCRLVLVSILDGGRLELDVPFDAEATTERFHRLVRAWIERARQAAARAGERAAIAGDVCFPFDEVRPHQQQLMDAIARGLAERRPVLAAAPTGLGKTVAALVTALRHAMSHNATLYFCTARNSQQDLVSRTFASVCAASGETGSGLRALTLRAKARMCPPGHLRCHPEHCEHLRRTMNRQGRERAIDDILGAPRVHVSPDDVFATGVERTLCPAALAFELCARVDLVIGDVNYVHGPGSALHALRERCPDRGAVVVLDEAHNLFDRMREHYSPFVSLDAACELESQITAGKLIDSDHQLRLPLAGATHAEGGVREAALQFLGRTCSALQAVTRDLCSGDRATVQGCVRVAPEALPWEELAAEAVRLTVLLADHDRTLGIVRGVDPLVGLCREVVRVRDQLRLAEEQMVPYASLGAGARDAGLGVLCVDPSRRLHEEHVQLAGTVAMSATLTPLEFHARVLGFAEMDPLLVSVPSPFPPENREVIIDTSVTTLWRERDRNSGPIARLIERAALSHGGNLVVYLPSFDMLARIHSLLELSPRRLLVQHPNMAPAAADRILDALREASGDHVLLAVMGGMLSEGVDLPGPALTGAIIVGTGQPAPTFERVQMREHFDRQDPGRGYRYAMLYPGMQRVIQAAGRVHRTPTDEGFILLADRRFTWPDVSECLPSWWQLD